MNIHVAMTFLSREVIALSKESTTQLHTHLRIMTGSVNTSLILHYKQGLSHVFCLLLLVTKITL